MSNIELPGQSLSSSIPQITTEVLDTIGNYSIMESNLSKNKLRKLKNYEKRLKNRSIKRDKERLTQKQNQLRRRPHEDEKQRINKKLLLAQLSGPQVIIDCQFENCMTVKEQRRFAQQLRRVYSSNKVATSPLHLYFTSLSETSTIYNTCCKINDGFSNYIVDRNEKSFLQLFSNQLEEMVYLTPDAPNPLDSFDPNKIYIIGGLVDETTTKSITQSFTKSNYIHSARLPIQEYFTRGNQGTYKTVLTLNQIVDIILKWYETKDWIKSIQAGLPLRTGFIPKEMDIPITKQNNKIQDSDSSNHHTCGEDHTIK